MCDFAPRDGINMTDALEEHRRVICAAFGIRPVLLYRHPFADFYQALRETEAQMSAFVAAGLRAFLAPFVCEEQLAEFHRKFDVSINEQIAASEQSEGGSSSGDIPQPPSPIAGAAAAFDSDEAR